MHPFQISTLNTAHNQSQQYCNIDNKAMNAAGKEMDNFIML